MRLSLLLGFLVGWVYAETNRAGSTGAGDQCTAVGSALGPTLKRKIRKSLGNTGAPDGQDNALSMKVCDPALVAMLPALGTELAHDADFREMTKLFKGGDDLGTMSVIKSLMSNGARRGP